MDFGAGMMHINRICWLFADSAKIYFRLFERSRFKQHKIANSHLLTERVRPAPKNTRDVRSTPANMDKHEGSQGACLIEV